MNISLVHHPFADSGISQPFFQDNLERPVPEGSTVLDFAEARGDWVAVASAGPYANHLHLVPDR